MRIAAVLALTLFTAASPAAVQAAGLRDDIAKDMTSLEALYRTLHQNPELSGQEINTAKRLAKEARDAGFSVTENVGGHGIVAVLKNGDGPTVMIRTDMDALPVAEKTGLAFSSRVHAKNPNGEDVPVMHACGHDAHMTIWTGVARRMAAMKDRWSGTLVMIGQPAEETVEGAHDMLKDGLFTRFPKPDYNLALHDSASMPAGTVGYTSGYALAAVDSVDIEVKGIGGHGAYPHTTRDPIVLSAEIVMALQTLVSRNVDPLDSAVVTVGSIHGGAKHNIIGDSVHMQMTVRSYKDETRKMLLDGIKRIAEHTARAYGMPEDRLPLVTFSESTPSTANAPGLVGRIVPAMKAALGDASVQEMPPVMGSEDFSYYGRTEEKIPSAIFWVGGVNPEKYAATKEKKALPSLHSPFWAPDAKPTIETGVAAMTSAALELLKKN